MVLTVKLQKNPEIYMKKYVEKSPTQRKTLKAGKHEFFLSNSNAEQRSISIGRAEPTAWNCAMKQFPDFLGVKVKFRTRCKKV